MEMKLELVPIPVSDVDRAKMFYTDRVESADGRSFRSSAGSTSAPGRVPAPETAYRSASPALGEGRMDLPVHFGNPASRTLTKTCSPASE